MTKVADFAEQTDALLALVTGNNTVATQLQNLQPKLSTLALGIPTETDAIVYTESGSGAAFRTEISSLKTLIGGGGGGSPVTWEWGVSGKSDTLTKLLIGKGLVASGDSTAEIAVSDDILANLYAPSYLALASNTIVVTADENVPPDRAAVWFENKIVTSPNIIIDNREHKSIMLEPRPNNASELFLVVFLVNLEGTASDAGHVRVFVRDKQQQIGDATLYLTDINGDPLAIQRQFDRGQALDTIMLAAVVNITGITELTFHVTHSFSGGYAIANTIDKPSAIMVQALDIAPKATIYFEQFTRIKLNWLIRNFYNPIATLLPALMTPSAGWLYDRPDKVNPNLFREDGFTLNSISNKIGMGIAGRFMSIYSDENARDVSNFYLSYDFSPADTHLLRGRRILVRVSPPDGQTWGEAGNVSFMGWRGADASQCGMIITGSINDQPTFGAGWSVIGESEFPVDATGKTELEVTVPGDIVCMAALIRPLVPEDPMLMRIGLFEIEVEQEFSSAILRMPTFLDVTQLHYQKLQAIFSQDNQGYGSLRYTINATESAAPCGRLQAGATLPVDIDTKVNTIPGSMARGGEGAIRFTQAVTGVTIATTINVRAGENLPKGQTTTVTFTWYAVDKRGKFTPYPNGSADITIKGGGLPVNYSFGITGDFKAGDRLALKMKTGGADWAYMQSNSSNNPTVYIEIRGVGLA